jgi:integrase
MNAGIELEFHNNTKYQRRGFKVEMSSDDDIYLDENELNSLYELKLPFNSLKDRVRDLFLIGATTGFRISDLNTLTELNIVTDKGRKYITKTSQKTKTPVSLPLTKPLLIKTLEKRDYKFPKAVHENSVNEIIKTLCELAKITSKVRLQDSRLKGSSEIIKRKCDLVKSHTARRSFCTNAYLSGMEAQKIMEFSGHKKLDTFLRYIKADHLQKARLYENEPFFIK